MAEVLVRFTTPVQSEAGDRYHAQACGGMNDDGLWEGWIEFTSAGTGSAVRSGRETTQPNRNDLVYWAKGLTEVYLEGSLRRALGTPPESSPTEAHTPSKFSEPAGGRPSTTGAGPQAVLDPINTYAQGEQLLRDQLAALSRDNLVGIVKAYKLEVPDEYASFTTSRLVDAIVSSVKKRVDG